MRRGLFRFGEALLTLWLLVTLCFVLMRAAPGGPFDVEREVTPEIRARLEARYHLDEPLPSQYLRYLGQLAQGDLGPSFQYPDYTVNELIAGGLQVSVPLGFAALVLALLVGVPLGLLAGWHEGRIGDHVASGIGLIGLALPKFVLAPLLVLCFAVWLGWLPSFGRGDVTQLGFWSTGLLTTTGLKALILPSCTLGLFPVTLIMRLVRSEMMEVLRTDYIKFARARGLTDRAVHFRHALKNTLLPVITVIGIQVGGLIAFSIITETVFQWPGMGHLFIQSVQFADIPVMAAYLVMVSLIFVTINFFVDLLYAAIDPRLRLDRARLDQGVAGAVGRRGRLRLRHLPRRDHRLAARRPPRRLPLHSELDDVFRDHRHGLLDRVGDRPARGAVRLARVRRQAAEQEALDAAERAEGAAAAAAAAMAHSAAARERVRTAPA